MIINILLIRHDTNELVNGYILQFSYLYYHVTKEKLAYQELSNVINELIRYRFRPINTIEILFRNLVNRQDQYLTFEELHKIDLTLSSELFWNCSKAWFGLKCQYSFEFREYMSIIDVVENKFNIKQKSFSGSSNISIE